MCMLYVNVLESILVRPPHLLRGAVWTLLMYLLLNLSTEERLYYNFESLVTYTYVFDKIFCDRTQ